jgi:hypothetical protein
MDIKDLIKKKKKALVNSREQTTSYEDYMASQIDKSNTENLGQLKSRIESKRREIEKIKSQICSIEINLKESTKDLSNLLIRLDSYDVKSHNGFYFFVTERRQVEMPNNFSDFINELKNKSRYGNFINLFLSIIQIGEIDIFFGKKVDEDVVPIMIKYLDEDLLKLIQERISIKSENKDNIIVSADKLTYVGDILSWNELVDILHRLGFEQDSDFDILSGSNSYGI